MLTVDGCRYVIASSQIDVSAQSSYKEMVVAGNGRRTVVDVVVVHLEWCHRPGKSYYVSTNWEFELITLFFL